MQKKSGYFFWYHPSEPKSDAFLKMYFNIFNMIAIALKIG